MDTMVIRRNKAMGEYIKRKPLIEAISSLSVTLCGNEIFGTLAKHSVVKMIYEQPAADVVEVRRGKWKLHDDGSATCSECGCRQLHIWDFDNHQNFCGVCGADMRWHLKDGAVE
jgi:hypothetical protein